MNDQVNGRSCDHGNNRERCVDCDIIEAERIAKNWEDTAAQMSRNADFYHGIVTKIGEMFGEEARTSDDGSVQDSVLALKVPELVENLYRELKRFKVALTCDRCGGEIENEKDIKPIHCEDCFQADQFLIGMGNDKNAFIAEKLAECRRVIALALEQEDECCCFTCDPETQPHPAKTCLHCQLESAIKK